MSEQTGMERFRAALNERGIEWQSAVSPDFPEYTEEDFTFFHSNGFDWLIGVNEEGDLAVLAGNAEITEDGVWFVRGCTPEQAIAATLGEDEKLLDLAHHAWSIAVCAMQGTPIPASWGDAVEKGLRERGIDVDELPYVVPDATLGGGECEWVWVESWTDTTDGRECDYAHWMPDCGCWSEYDRRFSDFDDYAEKPTGIAFCERCGKAVKR